MGELLETEARIDRYEVECANCSHDFYIDEIPDDKIVICPSCGTEQRIIEVIDL